MPGLAAVLVSLVLSQAPAPQTPSPAAQPAATAPSTASAADRAAAAAEKAAQAAQVAAEAAQRAADAAAKIAAGVPAKPAAAPAPAPVPPGADRWSGTIGVGLISLTGNARSITGTANASVSRKTDGWILGGKLSGTYGESRNADGSNQVLAEAAAGQLRVDRLFDVRYTGYVLGGLETDHVKSIELRSYGEVGATIVWVDAAGSSGWKTYLRTDLGYRLTQDRRYQYFAPNPADVGPLGSVTLNSPRAALAFRYDVTKDVLFSEDADIMPNVVGASRVLANSVTKIAARLSRSLSFGTTFTVAHDSAPAPGKRPTDTTLAVTLEAIL